MSNLGESTCAPRIFIPFCIGSLPKLKRAMDFFILTAYTLSPAFSSAPDAITSSKFL